MIKEEDELQKGEREAISAYKDYADRHLPEVDKLSDLVVMNFDQAAYPKTEVIDALRKYLDELEPYCKVISEAARLRQLHYEHFIAGKKEEDPGHRLWREGFNAIVEDAQQKLHYWSEVHEKLLKKLIDSVEKQPETLERLNLYAHKIQAFFYAQAKEDKPSKEKTKIVRYKRPVLSKAQKIQLKNAAQQQRKFQRELDEKAMEESKKLADCEWMRITGKRVTFNMDKIAKQLLSKTFVFDYGQAGKLMGEFKLVGEEISFKHCASYLNQHFYHLSTLAESTQYTRDLWELFLALKNDNAFVNEYFMTLLQLFLEGHFEVDRFRSAHYQCSFAFAQCLGRFSFDYRSLTMMEPAFLEIVRAGEERNYDDFIEMYCTILVNGPCLCRMVKLNECIVSAPENLKWALLVLSNTKQFKTNVELAHQGKTYKTDKYLLWQVKTMEDRVKPLQAQTKSRSKRGKRR